jgi:hypothetical protein
MKFLFFLLVIVVACGAGYFSHPKLYEFAESKRSRVITDVKQVVVSVPGNASGAGETSAPVATTPSSVADALLNKMKGTDPTPAPKTQPGSTPVVAKAEDEFDRKYPLPKFRDIEEITRNWTWMPTKAFPKPIKNKEAITFQAAAGKVTVVPNTQLQALAMENAMVTVARSAQDALQAVVPLAATDLKETMVGLYDAYRTKMTNRIMAQRDYARNVKLAPPAPPVAVDDKVRLAGAEPAFNENGQLPEMMASMAKGDVTEVKPTNIIQWGAIEFVREGNSGFWTCTVTCRMSTIFGEVDTEVTAFINRGKVVRWIYTGSKEPVQ